MAIPNRQLANADGDAVRDCEHPVGGRVRGLSGLHDGGRGIFTLKGQAFVHRDARFGIVPGGNRERVAIGVVDAAMAALMLV